MASIDPHRINRMAHHLKTFAPPPPLNFYSFKKDDEEIIERDKYPCIGAPHALDFFFLTMANTHGFWLDDGHTYTAPLTGVVSGIKRKGADLLFTSMMHAYWEAPVIVTPQALDALSAGELRDRLFRDDNGTIPYPDLEGRIKRTKEYARFFTEIGSGPEYFVNDANRTGRPVASFIEATSSIPGYSADRLLKKNTLLAMALANRPEQYLKPAPDDIWPPIIDYHLMRLAIRSGMVKLTAEEHGWNERRLFVTAEQEAGIRQATYDAMQMLITGSGRPMAEIDGILWHGREYCPEMEEPECVKCPLVMACERKTKLFQPVFRTSAY